MKQLHRVRRILTRIATDESLDLYILAVTAFIFTILGITGISSVTDLTSIILALLAVLALSQIRSRRHVAAIANAQHADPLSLRARILGTLDELASLRDGTGGQLEIRVASFALTAGINAVDAESPDGILVVQHYEHKPPEEATRLSA